MGIATLPSDKSGAAPFVSVDALRGVVQILKTIGRSIENNI
jgi:hypothetical protein